MPNPKHQSGLAQGSKAVRTGFPEKQFWASGGVIQTPIKRIRPMCVTWDAVGNGKVRAGIFHEIF